MSKTATPTLTPQESAFDFVDVMDEDDQDWLPLGEPEEATLRSASDSTPYPGAVERQSDTTSVAEAKGQN
jgi:hypothetical protein